MTNVNFYRPKMQGIDMSHWQAVTDFVTLSRQVDFIILKAGGSDAGFYKDPTFENRYNVFTILGVNLGCYYFVGPKFITAADGLEDAKRFAEMLKGKRFSMPVYLDLEATSAEDRNGATDAAIAFCRYLESLGYYVGIYASDVYGFKERLDESRLRDFDTWVARYNSEGPKYMQRVDMWQYSEHGSVEGIKGNSVDMDYCYINYPDIMKKAHKNGF